MIQRIQTIWFLLAATSVFLTLRFSTYAGTNKELVPSSFLNGLDTLPMTFVTFAIGIIALVAIFLYKNRKLQVRLAVVALLLEALLIFLYYSEIQTYTGKGAYTISAAFHIAVILFLLLAARGVKADEKLIRDSSRLR